MAQLRSLKIELSVGVLSGGFSRRLGSDKAFLSFEGVPFIKRITDEMLKISEDVAVVIGKKNRIAFESILNPSVKILNDELDLANPMSGMLTMCKRNEKKHTAFVGCDMPLLKSEVIGLLFGKLEEHSAAVPIWEDGNVEPLCAVYNTKEALEAGSIALREGRIGCKNLILHLRDVLYFNVSDLRSVDPCLDSLKNVNSKEDFEHLESN